MLLLPEIGRTAAGDMPFWVGVVLFVRAATGWTVFVVHDTILVAIGRAVVGGVAQRRCSPSSASAC